MDFGLNGKVAMVAASTQGIGLACARALHEAGAQVSICGRNAEKFAEAQKEIGGEVYTAVCDVSDAESLTAWHESVVKDLGHPDIVITNTGGPPAGSWTDMTDEQWQSGVDSTLLNVVRLVRLTSPAMREKKWGRYVHITSVVAAEPLDLLPISSTLRMGLRALTRLQATELGPDGINVNAVLPGHTLTDRQRHLAEVRSEKFGITVDEALEKQAQRVPLKRLADPMEIARPAAFLCSDLASYITGVSLLVDGGTATSFA